jgi:hypothetical protein
LHSFSHLESIEVFTSKENVNLIEVFEAMQKSSVKLPDTKADAKEIKAYFQKVYPDMDFERVYGSDMKKMIKWFALLVENKIEIKLSDSQEGDSASAHEVVTPKAKSAEPKQAAVKAAPPKKINSPRKMA